MALASRLTLVLCGVVSVWCASVARGSAADHTYLDNEEVVLWANKVGPYHNPSETYPYYSVPGCPQLTTRPLQTQPDSLGVLLEGDTLVDTGLSFPFKREQQFAKVCDLTIVDQEMADQLEFIVENHYWYHLLLDDLPLFGMIGEYITRDEMQAELAQIVEQAKANGERPTPVVAAAQGFIYTHRDYSIAYNNGQVIEVNLTSENPRPIAKGETYPITFSVTWTPTNQPFDERFNRYLDFDFFEHKIHWFSILNSFMLVVFLCGLVLLILSRTIKTTLAGPTFADAEAGYGGRNAGGPGSPNAANARDLDALGEETGWKLLVGDVFRAPKQLLLYSVLLGTGVQLAMLVFAVLTLALVTTYYDESRGTLATLLLLAYTLSSGVQGYVSGWHYKLHGGLAWKRAAFFTAAFYPAVLLVVLCFLNVMAFNVGSHGILSLGTTLLLSLLCALVSVPLTIGGTLWARSATQANAQPCRVNAIRRLIPSESTAIGAGKEALASLPLNPNSTSGLWYTEWHLLVVMAGVLPFGAIFVELYFALSSFWNYKYQYLYSFIFLVFLILLIVTVCVSVVSTYILLNSEDYRWHWLSFCTGASSAAYMFGYSIVFYLTKTHMTGLLQTTYYFASALVAFFTLALITGAIGALGTRLFIQRIYSLTKAD